MERIYGEKNITLPETLEIPEISKEKLVKRYSLLKPIITIDETKYLLREFNLAELTNMPYIWNTYKNKREIINEDKLETIDDFLCLHARKYQGLFRPTIAEVLLQMREELIEKANTFEIIESPETRDDLFKYPEVLKKGLHLSRVRAYKLHK